MIPGGCGLEILGQRTRKPRVLVFRNPGTGSRPCRYECTVGFQPFPVIAPIARIFITCRSPGTEVCGVYGSIRYLDGVHPCENCQRRTRVAYQDWWKYSDKPANEHVLTAMSACVLSVCLIDIDQTKMKPHDGRILLLFSSVSVGWVHMDILRQK